MNYAFPMDASLFAVSPVDGRYRHQVEKLSDYFSEAAIIRYRVRVEVDYFIALCRIPLPQLKEFNSRDFSRLRKTYLAFMPEDAARVKEIEKVTNHDVKAVEYFLKERFDQLGLGSFREFIHFGLTSQDINNTAFPMAMRDAWAQILEPAFSGLYSTLKQKSELWKHLPMLAHTHGQPASPTTMGKELYVFAERLSQQLALIETIPFSGKFGGASGNLNAHVTAYPMVDWISFANRFLADELELERLQTTTQIDHYDNMAAFFDNLKRINTILIDLNRDMWSYISMEYFRQKVKRGETGSSAMPHKVNPIDFENSEGNLGMANAVLEHLAAKLPVSRLQRDLTDSTVLRNIGVPFAHTLIAVKSLLRGLEKVMLNERKLSHDLQQNWAVISEAIQTILRREGYPNPFEALKALTRGKARITKKSIHAFIDSLDVKKSVKEELKQVTPESYTGIINL
jgi:adenylosuccinate lyase